MRLAIVRTTTWSTSWRPEIGIKYREYWLKSNNAVALPGPVQKVAVCQEIVPKCLNSKFQAILNYSLKGLTPITSSSTF